MITELSINDHAGTVVSRINAAIEEQNKGVDTLGANPNASTVISRVNAAITAENNDQLEEVTNSDNAADFIRKVNALFSSINAGGGDEPGPGPDPEPDYAYWNGKRYIAFGDSLTHVSDSWSGGPYLNQRYCYLVSMPTVPVNEGDYEGLGMVLTNAGVSGSMMLYNGKFQYPIISGSQTSGIESPQRSFAYELLNPDNLGEYGIVNVADEDYNGQYRGPYGIDLTEYDLISLMFGGNDINQIYTYINHPNQQPYFAEIGTSESRNLDSFYGAYYRTVEHIVAHKRNDAVFVICIEPKATGNYFNRNGELIELIMYIAEHFSVPVVNFYDLEETIEIKNDGYGVHPTADGHIVMADYFKLRLGQIVHELNLRNE